MKPVSRAALRYTVGDDMLAVVKKERLVLIGAGYSNEQVEDLITRGNECETEGDLYNLIREVRKSK